MGNDIEAFCAIFFPYCWCCHPILVIFLFNHCSIVQPLLTTMARWGLVGWHFHTIPLYFLSCIKNGTLASLFLRQNKSGQNQDNSNLCYDHAAQIRELLKTWYAVQIVPIWVSVMSFYTRSTKKVIKYENSVCWLSLIPELWKRKFMKCQYAFRRYYY